MEVKSYGSDSGIKIKKSENIQYLWLSQGSKSYMLLTTTFY
jgi:hypothetical protein